MSYLNTDKILRKAKDNGYTVAAFNISDFNFVMAIIEAAEERNSPVIIQVIPKVIRALGVELITYIVEKMAKKVSIPVSLILDHGTDIKLIKKCITKGWNSVMFDGSLLPYKENIMFTKQVSEFAHKYDVSVEGELGQIYGNEDDISVDGNGIQFTDPKKVVEFATETGIDSLAVGIGTKHGLYNGDYKLNYSILKEIMNLVNCPIVIHGCSNLNRSDLIKLVDLGVAKVNISTDLKHIYIDSLKKYLKKYPKEYEPLNLTEYIKNNLKIKIKETFDILRSSGKA